MQHFWVNHSQKPHAEFSRPVPDVVANLETGATRDSMVGTMTIDPEWGFLKLCLPRNVSAKTDRERGRCDVLVRASQFRRMLSGEDRWPTFCKYAHEWIHQRHRSVDASKGKLGGFARKLAAKRKGPIPDCGGVAAPGESSVVLSEGERKGVENVLAADLVEVQATEQELAAASAALSANASGKPPTQAPAQTSLQQVMSHMMLEDVDELEAACKARRAQLAAAATDSHLRELSQSAWGDRYFETQDPFQAKCGRHALNNCFGLQQFDDPALDAACRQVVAETGDDELLHKTSNGWYSHGVIVAAIDLAIPPVWRLRTARAVVGDWCIFSNSEVAGAIVNVQNCHWTSISVHEGQCCYCDSLHVPVIIGERDWPDINARHPGIYHVVRQDSSL